MKEKDSIIIRTMTITYPFILLFGFYIIINGHKTPGGGFQGGAALAAIFIIRYLIKPVQDINLEKLQFFEKIFFFSLVMFPILFIFRSSIPKSQLTNEIYLILMNTIIGIKVCFGLTIIFYRFIFYESR